MAEKSPLNLAQRSASIRPVGVGTLSRIPQRFLITAKRVLLVYGKLSTSRRPLGRKVSPTRAGAVTATRPFM